MITWTNDSNTLAKCISSECKCKFDGKNCNSHQCWNNDKYWCECRKRHVYEKDHVWNPATWICENGKHFINQVLWMIGQLFAMILEEDAEAKFNDEGKVNYKETKTI